MTEKRLKDLDDDMFLTTREAAQFLGLNEQSLAKRRCMGDKSLKYYKLYGKIRYRVGDIKEFIAASLVC